MYPDVMSLITTEQSGHFRYKSDNVTVLLKTPHCRLILLSVKARIFSPLPGPARSSLPPHFFICVSASWPSLLCLGSGPLSLPLPLLRTIFSLDTCLSCSPSSYKSHSLNTLLIKYRCFSSLPLTALLITYHISVLSLFLSFSLVE